MRVMFMFGMRLVFICELETERERKQNKKKTNVECCLRIYFVFFFSTLFCVLLGQSEYTAKRIRKPHYFVMLLVALLLLLSLLLTVFFLFAE